jgi:hypothetical protein
MAALSSAAICAAELEDEEEGGAEPLLLLLLADADAGDGDDDAPPKPSRDRGLLTCVDCAPAPPAPAAPAPALLDSGRLSSLGLNPRQLQHHVAHARVHASGWAATSFADLAVLACPLAQKRSMFLSESLDREQSSFTPM